MQGIAKGEADDILHGTKDSTHINIGVACTTGTSGQNYAYCTVSGGVGNVAAYELSTIAGGKENKVRGVAGFIGAGKSNRIEDADYSAIVSGETNRIFDSGDSCAATMLDIELMLSEIEDDSLAEMIREQLRENEDSKGYNYSIIGAGTGNKICNDYNMIGAGYGNCVNGKKLVFIYRFWIWKHCEWLFFYNCGWTFK